MSTNWPSPNRGIFNPSVFSSAPDQAHQGKMDFKSQERNSLGPRVILVWPCQLADEDMPAPLLPWGSGMSSSASWHGQTRMTRGPRLFLS